MATIYNPLAEAKKFQERIGAAVEGFKASAAPPPTTPRLREDAQGRVWTREGQLLYTPPKPEGSK